MKSTKTRITAFILGMIMLIGMTFISRAITDKNTSGEKLHGLQLTHTYEEKENGNYGYRLNARWMAYPSHQDKDTIGLRIMNSQVDLSSAQLWYEVDKITSCYQDKEDTYSLVTDHHLGQVEEEHVRIDVPVEMLHTTSVGKWQGIEGQVMLPKEEYNTDHSVTYENMTIVMMVDGQVYTPTEAMQFDIEPYYQHGSHLTTSYDAIEYKMD